VLGTHIVAILAEVITAEQKAFNRGDREGGAENAENKEMKQRRNEEDFLCALRVASAPPAVKGSLLREKPCLVFFCAFPEFNF